MVDFWKIFLTLPWNLVQSTSWELWLCLWHVLLVPVPGLWVWKKQEIIGLNLVLIRFFLLFSGKEVFLDGLKAGDWYIHFLGVGEEMNLLIPNFGNQGANLRVSIRTLIPNPLSSWSHWLETGRQIRTTSSWLRIDWDGSSSWSGYWKSYSWNRNGGMFGYQESRSWSLSADHRRARWTSIQENHDLKLEHLIGVTLALCPFLSLIVLKVPG